MHAAIQAAKLLHSHCLVHTDMRAANILWLNDNPFVIDLEQVHRAGYKVCCLLHLYLLVGQPLPTLLLLDRYTC